MNVEIASVIYSKNRHKSKLIILSQGLDALSVAAEYLSLEKTSKYKYSFLVCPNSQHKAALKSYSHIRDNTESSTKKKREKMYKQGGCFYVTESVLYMDVMEDLVKPDQILSLVLLGRFTVDKLSSISVILNKIKIKNEVSFEDSNLSLILEIERSILNSN